MQGIWVGLYGNQMTIETHSHCHLQKSSLHLATVNTAQISASSVSDGRRTDQRRSMLPPTYAVMSTVRIDNADTAHPNLQISLPESFFIASQRSHSCQAAVLMKWPPEAFLDPFTFPFSSDDLIDSVETLNGTSSHRDFTRVELEKSTGYSLDRETRTLAAQCTDEKLRRSYVKEEYTASLLYLKDNL